MKQGTLKEAIIACLQSSKSDLTSEDITNTLLTHGRVVLPSSVRSCLSANTPDVFERVSRGRYRLSCHNAPKAAKEAVPAVAHGRAALYHADCFEWLQKRPVQSIHAVVTDPPYGLLEYTPKEQTKLRAGKGGVWRIPPSFDGHKRSPIPRFTVLDADHHAALRSFFERLAISLLRVCVPGANVIVASNPLLAHLVAGAMVEGGLELRGTIVRLVMTMRGGDRPKNAHDEFPGVSVMPRSQWEPWLVFRKPIEGRVQDNLRKWGTGGFRRISGEQPFGDVVKSAPTPSSERRIAPHPSLKPQAFMRQLVRGCLPLGRGVVFDPFAGAASTLAAANAVGYESIGTEIDPAYVEVAGSALQRLSLLGVLEINPIASQLEDPISVKGRSSRAKLASGVLPKVGLRNVG